MSKTLFQTSLILIAIAFTLFFCITIVPPLMKNFQLVAALTAGFVNPYAAGYSTDVIACWFILAIWVIYDRQRHDIPLGYLCLLLGLVPGVAVGLALYLLIRTRYFDRRTATQS